MLTCGVSHMNGRRRNATPVCENTRKRWWNPFSQPKHCSFLLWGFLVLSSIYNSKLLTNKKGNYKKLSVCGIVHLCLAQGVCHDVEGYGDPVPITPQVCIACMLHVGGEQGEGAWRCGDGVHVTGPPHRVAHVRGPDQACSNCFAQLYQPEQYFQQFTVSAWQNTPGTRKCRIKRKRCRGKLQCFGTKGVVLNAEDSVGSAYPADA